MHGVAALRVRRPVWDLMLLVFTVPNAQFKEPLSARKHTAISRRRAPVSKRLKSSDENF